MTGPTDDIDFDRSKSCTKDEAAAKLLRLVEGDTRRRFSAVTGGGISVEQLRRLRSHEGSLLELLKEQGESAFLEYIDAFNAGAPREVQEKMEAAILFGKQEIKQAKSYLRDIDDELANGEASLLRVDRQGTAEAKMQCIFLSSLDLWARQNYDIYIFGTPVVQPEVESPVGRNGTSGAKLRVVEVKFQPDDEKSAEDFKKSTSKAGGKVVEDLFVNREESDGLSRTVADNLYITLALLIESYVQNKGPRYKKSHGGITVENVAADVMQVIDAATKDNPLPGQKRRTIVGHIAEALRTKGQVQRALYGSRSST